MIQHSAENIYVMRMVLEEAMMNLPPNLATTSAKAFLAEAILKAAAKGIADHDDLLAAASKCILTRLTR